MSREAMSEQSSVCEGAGYNKVFQSGHKPEEGLSWLLKRETSTHSLDEEVESCDGEEVEEEEVDEGDEGEKGEDDGDEGEVDERTPEGGSTRSPGDEHTRPFILPKIWTVNDFKPTMTTNIFKNLRDRYQIPNHIPICLLRKFKKCYSGKTADVGIYDFMFTATLRLPLTALHRQLANFLGSSVSQIVPNAWRIIIGAEILWGHLSGGNRQLSLGKFFIATNLSTSSRPKEYTTLLYGRKSLGSYQICPTQIGIGKVDTSLFRGRTRYAIQRSGLQCPMVLTILGVLSKIQV